MQEVEVLERGLGWLESTVVCGEVGGGKEVRCGRDLSLTLPAQAQLHVS